MDRRNKAMKKQFKGNLLMIIIVAMFILGSTAILSFLIAMSQNDLDNEVVIKSNDSSIASAGNDTGDDDNDMIAEQSFPDHTVSYPVIPDIPHFPVNEYGQTYGSEPVLINDYIVYPELIYTTGLDGIVGYVSITDLDYTYFGHERPGSPEEFLMYMRLLQARDKVMRIRESEKINAIALYAVDGRTVLGEFGISSFPPEYLSRVLWQVDFNNDGFPETIIVGFVDHGAEMKIYDVTIKTGESVELHVLFDDAPECIKYGDIIWSASEEGAVRVVPSEINPNAVTITAGRNFNRGGIILKAQYDDITAECIVRIRDVR